jgi:hypothetical protein
MTGGRRAKARWITLAISLVMTVLVIVRLLLNRTQPVHQLLQRDNVCLIIADRAWIRHDYPKGRSLRGHNTLVIVNPQLFRPEDKQPDGGMLIIGDDKSLSRQLPLAIETSRQFGGSYALPRTNVSVWQIERDRACRLDAAGVTYLDIP